MQPETQLPSSNASLPSERMDGRGAFPVSTYRVQLRPEFTLRDAAEIVPYLRALGISHLYASPILQAVPGSTHGYDVVDYNRVSAELGGQAAFDRLQQALRENGMGMVLDIVPNHMAMHPTNPWWWDVLTHGPSSRYAWYFDVEWNLQTGRSLPAGRSANQVLVPVLGDQYGRVLEDGQIRLVFHEDAGRKKPFGDHEGSFRGGTYDEGTFIVQYGDQHFPVDPGSLGILLNTAAQNSGSGELAELAAAFDRLPKADEPGRAEETQDRYRQSEALRERLQALVRGQPAVGEAIRAVVAVVNASPDVLDAFLARQNYRLAYWKISASELGYRRFFDINTLVGLRMEDLEVYRDTHALVLLMIQRGDLEGLRIDHPDGLSDPRLYFDRLRADAPNAWIVIEKILEPGERLPDTWPVQGTTGYDFLNRVNGLWVNPRAEEALTHFYRQFTNGSHQHFESLMRKKKLLAANEVLGSDLNYLTELFSRVCDLHRRYRDTSLRDLRAALAETAAGLPVYRTYLRPGGSASTEPGPAPSPADAAVIERAIQSAKDHRPDLDPRLLDFLGEILMMRLSGPLEEDLVRRFQQFTGPLMAKGVEDTAFYIENRLIALNEVGGDPARFGLSPADFHRACQETQARWPYTMLDTSTHDTKRSEDVRARLDAITELDGEWIDAVRRWTEMNERHRVGEWPDHNTEYLLYQTLVGAWPISTERVVEFLQKAGREARVYTTWTAPIQDHEEAVAAFAAAILADTRFTADLETFVARVLEPGRINSLAQTLLKITTPGIPDFYQGTELWNLSLVDPDNRRPVDFAHSRRLLEQLRPETTPEEVLEHMDSGLPKLWVIRQGLALRNAHPEWFGAESSYTPVYAVYEEEEGTTKNTKYTKGGEENKNQTKDYIRKDESKRAAEAASPAEWAPRSCPPRRSSAKEAEDIIGEEAGGLPWELAGPGHPLAETRPPERFTGRWQDEERPVDQPDEEEDRMVAVTGEPEAESERSEAEAERSAADMGYLPAAVRSFPAPEGTETERSRAEGGAGEALSAARRARASAGEEEPVVAFLRGDHVLVAVPRLPVSLRSEWGRCRLPLPPGRWQNRLTHEWIQEESITLEALWSRFPAALLVKE